MSQQSLPQLVRIVDWYSIHALLQYPNSAVQTSSLLSLEQNQRAVLPRRVADAETATSDPQHCWRRVSLPARQCASTLCSWHNRASVPWRTPVHQSWHMWPANSPDLNPVDYRFWGILQDCVYRVPICDTDELRKRLVATWAEFQHSVVDYAWSVVKKIGSIYPCRRWSFWTLAVTLLAWHSSCHTSQPALFRATSVWRNATLHSVRWTSFAFYKVVRWHFSGVVGKGVTVCFLLR